MHNINGNAVQGHLSKNYLMRKIICAQNICNLWYNEFAILFNLSCLEVQSNLDYLNPFGHVDKSRVRIMLTTPMNSIMHAKTHMIII